MIIDVITKLLVNWVLRGVAQEGLSQLQVGLMLLKFQFKFPKWMQMFHDRPTC